MINKNIDDTAFNQAVKGWSKQVKREMKNNVRVKTNNRIAYRERLSAEREHKPLRKSIRMKIIRHYGIPDRIVFPFEKHGFFLQVGASRGHPYKTNPREKVDWYDSVMEDEIPKLADIVMQHTGDRAMKYAALDPNKNKKL